MPFDDSQHRTIQQQSQDRLDATAKKRLIDTYREPFLAAIKRCPCHCHLAGEGIRCGCAKDCAHCRDEDSDPIAPQRAASPPSTASTAPVT